MARPLRAQWRIRTVVRRRHRTWVASMVFATVGWGAWWVTVFLHKLAPELAPSILTTSIIACIFASVGFFLAVFTVRARLIWVLLAGVPLFANGSLLLLPMLVSKSNWLEPSPAAAAEPGETPP